MLLSHGILFEQLANQAVTEIHIIGTDHIIVKRNGLNESIDGKFENIEALIGWLNRLLADGQQASIDTAQPIREFHYDITGRNNVQRARVHVVLPPLAPEPIVTIAKQTLTGVSLSELVSNDTMTYDAAEFLETCVTHRVNLLIAGGAGSGKTTLMQCLLGLIPTFETVGIIEEMPELSVSHPNAIYMYNRAVPSPNRAVGTDVFLGALVEWAEMCALGGEFAQKEINLQNFLLSLGAKSLRSTGLSSEPVTLARLVKESLRMRLDRIAIGEVRGPEALDLLVAMNTGALGSMGTIHSNSALDAIRKLQTLASTGGFLPGWILSLIAQAVDIVVFLRPPNGAVHGIGEIVEVTSRVVNDTTITTQPLFGRNPQDQLIRISQPSASLTQLLTTRKM